MARRVIPTSRPAARTLNGCQARSWSGGVAGGPPGVIGPTPCVPHPDQGKTGGGTSSGTQSETTMPVQSKDVEEREDRNEHPSDSWPGAERRPGEAERGGERPENLERQQLAADRAGPVARQHRLGAEAHAR